MEWVVLPLLLIFGLSARANAARNERIRQAYQFKPETPGSARFAENRDLRKAGLFKGKGVPIGYAPGGRLALHYPGVGHILTIAAARTGKGATLLVNALLGWKGSCIVIDPKAENVAITGHFRKRFGKVFVLNPFGMFLDVLKGLPQAKFNPMDMLDAASASFHAACDKLAAALVWDEGKEAHHFTTGARILISGVIAALIRHGQAFEKNLVVVARVISGDILGFCRLTVQSTTDPFIIQKLARFAAPGVEKSREVMDVIATAVTQLGFLGIEAIAENLSGTSDFRFSDLKINPGTTIYVCLPLEFLETCDKYFRLILETFLSDLLSERKPGKGRVLAIVDEMAQLGPHMKSLENAMGMAAGAAGLQLWCILQDLSQLKGMFPNTWETFIQNCGVTLWFGSRDHSTRDYVSRLSGTRDLVRPSRSVSIDHNSGEPHVSDSANVHTEPLLPPHQVGQLASDEMIAFIEGVSCGPVKAKRRFYFRCAELWGKYRANPYFRKG